MLDVLNTRISTFTGLIIILLVTCSVGIMIFWQLHQLMSVTSGVPEEFLEEKK